jgi:hypothetical protein
LASNEARNLGADGLRTEWVAFIENDVTMSDGWLDRLLAVAEERHATSAYPCYLEGPDGTTVHGMGAELTVTGPQGARRLLEHQHHVGERWADVRPTVTPVARVQGEPHAMVMRRAFLEQLGGFDEEILSWFDHVDLALHHQRLGADSWFVPDVTCVYHQPPPLGWSDVSAFALRWGGDWYAKSLRHLCAVWGLDEADPSWAVHSRYRRFVHRQVPTQWTPVNALLALAADPAERLIARRWAGLRRKASDTRGVPPQVSAPTTERTATPE